MGSARVKAAIKMMVQLTPGVNNNNVTEGFNTIHLIVKLIQSKKLLLKSIIKMENVSFKCDFEREKERRCFTEGYLNLIWLLRHFLGDHFGNVFSLSSEAKLNFCLYSRIILQKEN